jgi:hypothetical protein
MTRALPASLVLCSLGLAAITAAACGGGETVEPPVATPAVEFNHQRAAAGSPIDITYRFVVAPDAKFTEDYRVFVHVVDTDEEWMWGDDHNPPVPTTQWQPGQTIQYTRTVFIPIFPYVGDASIRIGLHSASGARLPLAGEDVGQRTYKVAQLHLLPQTENLFTVFKDGWHPAETDQANPTIEWQWTKREATLAFKNPKKEALFFLELDSPREDLHGPQSVTVSIGGQPIEQFTLAPNQQQLRKIKLTPEMLGSGEMSELQISVDKTFTPALVPAANSKDPRELGVRVFHAFVDPR